MRYLLDKIHNPKLKNWLSRLGWAGFLFFLIKGLLWLVAFYFGFSFIGG